MTEKETVEEEMTQDEQCDLIQNLNDKALDIYTDENMLAMIISIEGNLLSTSVNGKKGDRHIVFTLVEKLIEIYSSGDMKDTDRSLLFNLVYNIIKIKEGSDKDVETFFETALRIVQSANQETVEQTVH